jgi:cytochrome-b5 reductase
MTPYLFNLKVGDTVRMGAHPAKSLQQLEGKSILMLAGGTGIAPMIQILNALVRQKDFQVGPMTLVFSGVQEADLYEREKLNALAQQLQGKLTVHYSVLNPSADWTGLTGYACFEFKFWRRT